MDVDTTEIQLWVRQPDGRHLMRWVPLRELMKLMEQTARDTRGDVLTSGREVGTSLPDTPPE